MVYASCVCMLKPHYFLRETLIAYAERLAVWMDVRKGAQSVLVRVSAVGVYES